MIVHIVGNRPQFIKLAPLYHELDKRGYQQKIVHTGQHYDDNLSDVFFRELNIPEPEVNLAVGSGSHALMTAKAMVGVENYLVNNKTDLVILYGDTDTSAAAAMATSKLNIPIAHVEGGARTGNKYNPEEKNRIIVDHLSNIVFGPDADSIKHANEEGLGDITYCTGDIMYDTYMEVSRNVSVDYSNRNKVLMTWHRQENTSDKSRMESILNMIAVIDADVICPMHPRTVSCLKSYKLWDKAKSIKNFKIIEPVGYIEMVKLMNQSKMILTDSGGLSKESSFAGIKCLFMVNLDVWPDLTNIGWIRHINPDNEDDLQIVVSEIKEAKVYSENDRPHFYGCGETAKNITNLLVEKGFI